jgi:hypothetical protein
MHNHPDEQMLKVMANENLEDWGVEFIVTMETIHATVDAFAAGCIALPSFPASGNSSLRKDLRCAPDFRRDDPVDRPYTAQTLGYAEGDGWPGGGRHRPHSCGNFSPPRKLKRGGPVSP